MSEEEEASILPHRAAPVEPVRPRLAAAADRLLAELAFDRSELGRQARRFGIHMEEHVFAAARGEGPGGEASVDYRTTDEGHTVVIAGIPESGSLRHYERLAGLLGDVGVETLVLDSELESNQVADVLRTVWLLRRQLAGRRPGWWGRMTRRVRVCDALLSEDGYHNFCAVTRLQRDSATLSIRSSYCPLTFSRAVTAYMEWTSQFDDHRAFFRAAPRFGLLAAALALLPEIIVLALDLSPTAVAAMGATVAIGVGCATLVVFQTIGAVQYDKEHQARELQRRHEALMRAQRQIGMDLSRARRIQRSLIPGQGLQPFPHRLYMAHSFVPEMAVGGDYYDFRAIGDDLLGLIFVDVSGHGMSGAFVTGLIKTTFELLRDSARSPGLFTRRLNRILCDLTPPDSFAAMIYAVCDLSEDRLRWVNAGHNPGPLLVRSTTGEVTQPEGEGGLVLGVSPDYEYREQEIQLQAGDRVVLLTDGITEAANEAGELFGLRRARELLSGNVDQPTVALPDRILHALQKYTGEAPQTDDRTILAMELLARPEGQG
jgi:serine phosphatase RsbU (regulator of sigma subunit)